MFRCVLSTFVVLSSLTLVAWADTPDEQLTALKKEANKAVKAAEKAVGEAKNDKDRKSAEEGVRKVKSDYAGRFFSLAQKNPKDDAAVDALIWILQRAPQAVDVPKAAAVLERQYLQNPRIKYKLLALQGSEQPAVEHLVRAVHEKSKDKDAQGIACFTLALMLRNRAGDDKKLRGEAESLLDLCATKFANCVVVDEKKEKERTIGQLAKGPLFELRRLGIGKPAPDIVGEDLEGKKFKLSDYRGKVVMLSYWGTWCPHCMALVPHERELIKRYAGKPFVLIGVNSGDERDKLKPVLEKNQITWRFFWNGSGDDGPIIKQWNIQIWPTIFLIDQNGIIRQHFVGVADAKELDKALDGLVESARKGGKK